MACTLEELHSTFYEMLKKFSEYCEENSIKYVLHGGTLLGAVRHNGIIPWDDDVDVIMDVKNFNKFVKLIDKKPIDGMTFSWITTEKNYPSYHAKLRKNNTRMPEWCYKNLNICNGVWIDIFVYLDKPKTERGVKFQETIFKILCFLNQRFIPVECRTDLNSMNGNTGILKLLNRIPFKLVNPLRKLLYFILSCSGKKDSENVRDLDVNGKHNFCEPRSCFEPSIFHKFGDLQLRIPKNYDQLLRIIYGDDYMTPIRTHIHVTLENIELNTGE